MSLLVGWNAIKQYFDCGIVVKIISRHLCIYYTQPITKLKRKKYPQNRLIKYDVIYFKHLCKSLVCTLSKVSLLGLAFLFDLNRYESIHSV